MSALGDLPGRLYRGELSLEFVRRQKTWYTISGVILLVSVIAVLVLGLNFSVDFKGGDVFEFPAGSASLTQVDKAVVADGGTNSAIVQKVTPLSGAPMWQVQTPILGGHGSHTNAQTVQLALAHSFHISVGQVSVNTVGPSWGSEISQKAAEALVAFLIVVIIYLSLMFEWKMAAAAFVALLHDIVITIGVYALLRFTVSPATVIGLLTILGYSLYDTVVVFDKVRENTAGLLGSARSTYSDAANLALNQTLVRSINTSLIALLPVAAILFVGAGLLGAGELKDLALVLFVGMMSGAYSSIFIATPVLADLKERDPQYKSLAKRVAARAAGAARAAAKEAGAAATSGAAASRGKGAAEANAGLGNGGPARGTRATTRGAAGVTVAGDQGGDAADADSDVEEADPQAPEPVGAGQAAGRSGNPASGAPRQQPRRTSSARRRPSGKKRRR